MAEDWIDRLARGWRGYALILLIALAGALPGVMRMPVMDRDEARFVQATTQMLETGDFVRIHVQDTERNKKPIGIHWLQAAAVAAFSDVEAREIWAFRLPSVLGALLAGFAAFWGGAALAPRRTALIGAAMFSACLLLGFEAMTAKTDAALAGFTTLAMAALARLYAGGRDGSARGAQRGRALVFWAAMGAAVLIKGPVAPMTAGLTLLALGLWERRWRWMGALAFWPGPLLAAALVLPWMIAIGVATEGRFFAEALGGDLAPKLAGGQEGHGAPPGYHLLLLPLLIFPATLALPAAARLAWRVLRSGRSAEEHAGLRFLLAWAAPTFAAFEILPTKLAHYPLPTYPAIALLGAAGLAAARHETWRWTGRAGLALFTLAAAALAAGCAALTGMMPGDAIADERRVMQAALAGGALVLAAVAAMALARREGLRLGVALVAALTVSFVVRERILPEARDALVSREIVLALTREGVNPRDPNLRLWSIGYNETSLVFATQTGLRLAGAEQAGRGAHTGDVMIVEERERAALAARLAERGFALAPFGGRVSGVNYANGDDVSFTLARVSNAGGAGGPPQAPANPAR